MLPKAWPTSAVATTENPIAGVNEIDSALKEFKIYIQQLDLVDCDDDEKIRAVIDFMKAGSDRTTWSINGTVDEESFDDNKGHVLLPNQPLAVCDKTGGNLAKLGKDDIYISGSTYFYDGGGCC